MDGPSRIKVSIGLLALAFAMPLRGQAQEQGWRPRPPGSFAVASTSEGVLLEWTTHPGEPDPESWEIYRTDEFVDKLPYRKIETLSGSARSFFDADITPDTGYFYYIVAVGKPAPIDPLGLAGTPDGRPFRSNRYFTQTNDLAAACGRAWMPIRFFIMCRIRLPTEPPFVTLRTDPLSSRSKCTTRSGRRWRCCSMISWKSSLPAT